MEKFSIKLSHIILLAYIILLSIILKKFLIIPLIILVAIFALQLFISREISHFLLLALALSPFPSVLIIFIFYSPFALYGLFFKNSNFSMRYIFGYTITFFSAALVYALSVITKIPINLPLIVLVYFTPVAILISRILIKKNASRIKEVYHIDTKEFIALLFGILMLFYVAGYIINDQNMYMSNGTYMYTKFLTVYEGIKEFNFIPQYDERIAQGEQLFLSDTPIFYSNLAFVATILKINTVLFYNSMTAFILLLSIFSVWILISKVINPEQATYLSSMIASIGACSIVLSFTILHLFESFKQSSSYPHDFLGIALILFFFTSENKKEYLFGAISSLSVAFLIHPTKASGVILLAFSLFLIYFVLNNPKSLARDAFEWLKSKKISRLILFSVIIIFILMPIFYLYPAYHFRNFAREGHFPSLSEIDSFAYIKEYFRHSGINPLSTNYPDLRRLDEHKFGFFISYIGLFVIAIFFIFFKKQSFSNARLFTIAFVLHFVFSSIIVFIPPFPQGEYGYRTVTPYLLVTLAVCICAFFYGITNNSKVRIIGIVIMLVALLHSSYYAKQNLENIHSEAIISGQTFANEINFINQLPFDGRIMTLGLYSNAVDMALSVLTDHYFTRYGYLQWDFSDNIYDKLVTTNSFGVTETLEPLTGQEISNYLRLAGYKYLFLNICHPVGDLALKKVYPNYAYPIYQNSNYQCFVMLGINGTHYTEKVSLIEHVNESAYKKDDGYWHITFNRNKKIHNFNLQSYNIVFVQEPLKPIPLEFKRLNHHEVEIYGDFKDGNWVVFKEEYFPRWKAYMDGKEIAVLATNNRMILIKTIDGSKIELKYEMLSQERTATWISFPALIGLFVILILAI